MARLHKQKLLRFFEESVKAGGGKLRLLSAPGDHPAKYDAVCAGFAGKLNLYIWNLTPGGKSRPKDEWRIQVTGVSKFEQKAGVKTLILGWQDDMGVFAGFDVRHHHGELGSSPSFQLREAAIEQAAKSGFAPHNKGNGELVIAFLPEFLGTYVENLEALHDCGESPAEIKVLTHVAENPAEVDDEEIDDDVDIKRKYAVTKAWRAVRDITFRRRVLSAYGAACAMCDVQLNLLDAAHIVPVEHPKSTDKTSNGVALCSLHHRAYDCGLVTFDADLAIHVSKTLSKNLQAQGIGGGLKDFVASLRKELRPPAKTKHRPDQENIKLANKYRGW